MIICDMPTGAGKSTAAINKMNTDMQNKYIYITPFLDEVDRIKKACISRGFVEPQSTGKGKLENLNTLLGKNDNIASTHALFRQYDSYTTELIKNGGYNLILDEVFNVVEIMDIKKKDIDILFRDGRMIADDMTHKVTWLDEDYDGRFIDIMKSIITGNVIYYQGILLFWLFPVEVFNAFNEVIVLTYMFNAQLQRYYYDMHNLEYHYIGTKKTSDNIYEFTNDIIIPDYCKDFINKIHILEDEKMNLIGETDFSLSLTWYKRELGKRQKPLIGQIRRNIVNLFRNKYSTDCKKFMWTCYKEVQDILKGEGYTKSFVVWNKRATNDYRDKIHLAYCVNLYTNPIINNFFVDNNVAIDEDMHSLSDMVQWIFRSAIRDNKEIWLYVPSRRMRTLFKNWLQDLSKGE